MEGFNTVVPVEVKVRVKYFPGAQREPKEFCYRYFPWRQGQRPDDVRQFFPCDFKHNLSIGLAISGMEAKAAIGAVGVVMKKGQEEGQVKREEGQSKRISNCDTTHMSAMLTTRLTSAASAQDSPIIDVNSPNSSG